jgi:hypothetical protein
MNYYFLLEDEKSFIKVLPKWLEYLGFKNSRVVDIMAVEKDNYVMQSGQGVTKLIENVLYQTMDTILSSDKKIDYLVIILDAEEKTVEQRESEVKEKVDEYVNKNNCMLTFKVKTIVCNCCFETFLLGNRKIYPQETPSEDYFRIHYEHYNISENDPELMQKPIGVARTRAKYHFQYFHDAMLYSKKRYSKSKPDIVAQKEYFNELIERIDDTQHLKSFKTLVDFIRLQIEMMEI